MDSFTAFFQSTGEVFTKTSGTSKLHHHQTQLQARAPARHVLCEDKKNLYELISASKDHTLFKRLIDLAGLADLFKCDGMKTVFAPNNNAFRELTIGTIGDSISSVVHEGVSVSGDRLRHLILHHIVGASVTAATLKHTPELLSESGHPIIVSCRESSIYVNMLGRDWRKAARVVKADIQASNGLIHVIDEILLDPKHLTAPLTETVYDVICRSPCHTILKKLVDAAKIQANLGDCGSRVTFFAPSDAAFARLGLSTAQVEKLMSDEDVLQGILLAHVANGEYRTTELKHGQRLETQDTRGLQIRRCRTAVYILADGADPNKADSVPAISKPDILALNGVVHVIDRVITVNKRSVYHELQHKGKFKTLLRLIDAADLHAALDDCTKNYTLFAPCDEAFGCLPQAAIDHLLANPEMLKDVLLSHVLGARVFSNEVPLDHAIPTLSGKNIVAEERDDKLYVYLQGTDSEHSLVRCVDIVAYNGIIHAIKPVLMLRGQRKAALPPCVSHTPPCARPKEECNKAHPHPHHHEVEEHRQTVVQASLSVAELDEVEIEHRPLSPLPRGSTLVIPLAPASSSSSLEVTPLTPAMSPSRPAMSPRMSRVASRSGPRAPSALSPTRRASMLSSAGGLPEGMVRFEATSRNGDTGKIVQYPSGQLAYFLDGKEVSSCSFGAIDWGNEDSL